MTVEEELATYNRGVRAALKWAAGLVESKGCLCHLIPRENPKVIRKEHDPRCPVALAAKIRKGAS